MTTTTISTSPSPTTQPQPLTFPALTFAKLSPNAYLSAHLNSPTGAHRPSGRKPSQSRPPTAHTGSLTHTNGSAVVRCGDTAVVCGVRAEVLRLQDVVDYVPRQPDMEGDDENGMKQDEVRRRRRDDAEEMARLNLLVPNVELATGCSPAHLPGGPPSLLAQTLTQRILTLLHTSQLLRMDDLRIWSRPPSPSENVGQETDAEEQPMKPTVKAFYTLHTTLLFLSLSGPAFDPAWLALLAALRTTRLPRAWHDPDTDSVLCSPLVSDSRFLSLYDPPVALSFGVFHDVGDGAKGRDGKGRRWILADLDGFEEGICKEVGTVVVGSGGRVVRIEKGGGGGVGSGEMRALVRLAGVRREEWMRVMEGLPSG